MTSVPSAAPTLGSFTCGGEPCRTGWTCTLASNGTDSSEWTCAPPEAPPLWTYYAFFGLLAVVIACFVWCCMRCYRNRACCFRGVADDRHPVSAQAFNVNLPRPMLRKNKVGHDSDDDGTPYREETVRRVDGEIELG